MPILLIVDLLAEREGFGKKGVEEVVKHFSDHEILLWAPHEENPLDYSFGTRIDNPDEYDVVVDFDELNIDLYENIFSFGFMHMFSEKIYFTIKHNSFNIIDNTKQLEEFNINRLQFMFNMNL